MHYDKSSERFVLSTGTTFDAHCALLSPGPPGVVFVGYDEGVQFASDGNCFSPEERREIAAFMTAEWAKWAAS